MAEWTKKDLAEILSLKTTSPKGGIEYDGQDVFIVYEGKKIMRGVPGTMKNGRDGFASIVWIALEPDYSLVHKEVVLLNGTTIDERTVKKTSVQLQ